MAFTTSSQRKENAAPLSSAQEIVATIRQTIDTQGRDVVPLHEPLFKGNETRYVTDCIETGWVSSVGSYVDRFERDLAEFLGVKRVVATVNGTAALHLCLLAAGVQRDDEVLIPALTFVATANAVAYTGAVPHFCDTAKDSLNICPAKLDAWLEETARRDNAGACINIKTGRRIKAVIPMHCYGHPVDMDALNAVAVKYGLEVIEDAAESLGSLYKGRQTAGFGRMGALSFNGNKIMTTGGGGAIATNDEELGRLLKHLSTTAKTSKEGFFHHDMVGYNYRMPNINAALGCAQLERLPQFIESKRKLAEKYKATFSAFSDVTFLEESENTKSNYWLCAVCFHSDNVLNDMLRETNAAGLMTRPLWALMSDLPMYSACPKMDLSSAQWFAGRVMALPSSVNLV